MIQGFIAAIVILTILLGFCVNDNLNQRNSFSELKAAVKAANKHNKEAKDDREAEYKRNQEDSDARYDAMHAELNGRLGIMHNDRNKWLNEQYPTIGNKAEGLPPTCYDTALFNRAQQDSERDASTTAEQGEAYKLDLKETRDWASRQRWSKEKPKNRGLFLEWIDRTKGD